jgi:hypothetical protein
VAGADPPVEPAPDPPLDGGVAPDPEPPDTPPEDESDVEEPEPPATPPEEEPDAEDPVPDVGDPPVTVTVNEELGVELPCASCAMHETVWEPTVNWLPDGRLQISV